MGVSTRKQALFGDAFFEAVKKLGNFEKHDGDHSYEIIGRGISESGLNIRLHLLSCLTEMETTSASMRTDAVSKDLYQGSMVVTTKEKSPVCVTVTYDVRTDLCRISIL